MNEADAAVRVFAPCRLAFAGGGTDLPAYADRWGGTVLSAALTLGAAVHARHLDAGTVSLVLDDFQIRAEYGDVTEMLTDARPAVALVARAVAEGRPAGGVEVIVRTDLPPGSGLVTSGAVGVAVSYALMRLAGKDPTPAEVAEKAAAIEIEKLKRPIGRQDQYAAAFGGLNLFHFGRAGVTREPITLPPDKWHDFQRHFMLFFSGRRRDSAEVLAGQMARVLVGDRPTLAKLHRLKEIAQAMAAALGDYDLLLFGELMNAGWEAKRGLSTQVADKHMVELIERVRAGGAWAMKVMGAGAGGFYAVMAPPAAHDAVAAYLTAAGFKRYRFEFEPRGVRQISPRGKIG